MSLRDALREKVASVRSSSDNGGRRQVSERARQATRRAAMRARERAREVSPREAARRLANDEQIEKRSISDRARDAAEARAPIDATLDPGGNPRAIEAFASGAAMDERSEADAMGEREEMDDDPLGAAAPFDVDRMVSGNADDDMGEEDGHELHFDDSAVFGGED